MAIFESVRELYNKIMVKRQLLSRCISATLEFIEKESEKELDNSSDYFRKTMEKN